MKKLTVTMAALLVFTSGMLSAQDPAQGDYAGEPSRARIQEGLVVDAKIATRVHIRAARDFSRRFPGKQVTWRQSKDTSVAEFTADSMTTFVGYNKFGRWIYTVKCFSEWMLPKDVRHDVKSQFYDYRIDFVYQLSYPQNKNRIYLIYLADMNRKQKLIRWTDHEIEEVKKMRKRI